MARKLLFFFNVLIAFALSQAASMRMVNGRWQIVQTTIYAGTKAGLTISNDDGISWPKTPFKSVYINAIVVDDNNTKYLATSTGVYKSERDNDNVWVNVTEKIATRNVRAIYVSPNGQDIYAGGEYYSGNLRYTHDGGKTWGVKAIGKRTSSVVGLGVIGTTVFALTNNAGLYKSTTQGDSWRLVAYPKSQTKINSGSALCITNDRIYVGTDLGLITSDDQGVTWKSNSTTTPTYDQINTIYAKQIAGEKIETIYVGKSSGVNDFVFSKDRGQTWKKVSDDVYSVQSIFVSDDGTIFIGTDSGLQISADGIIWHKITKDHGLPDNKVTAIYAEDRQISDD